MAFEAARTLWTVEMNYDPRGQKAEVSGQKTGLAA